jgi:hypothetical protein
MVLETLARSFWYLTRIKYGTGYCLQFGLLMVRPHKLFLEQMFYQLPANSELEIGVQVVGHARTKERIGIR